MAKGLDGTAELLKKLNQLGDIKQTRKVLRQSAAAGMRKVQAEAKSRIPKGSVEHKTYKGRLVAPGFASRNLAVRTRYNKRTGAVYAVLGPKKEAFYATQFIELGTAKIPARPWLVPSFESKQDEAVSAMADAMRKRINKIARGGR